ncbi:hypothetical protein [Sphingomonas carotinifaciens]|uniref:hypothetical protein n=1 Tax=Sphingomonas carotinifaciens TaxID=1166323 RepID=UPI0013C2AF0D|nr:hypothetical protein [Sphingomonas carotinifaciens]
MGHAIVAQQLSRLARAADDEVAGLLQLARFLPAAEAGRSHQRVAGAVATIELPDREQRQASQQERYIGRDFTDAEDALNQLLLAISTTKAISSAQSGPIRAGITSDCRQG